MIYPVEKKRIIYARNQGIGTKGKIAIIAAAVGIMGWLGAAMVRGPVPRPTTYEPVSVAQAANANAPIEMTGSIASKPKYTHGNYYDTLEFKLQDGTGSTIDCKSEGFINPRFIPPTQNNPPDKHKTMDAYTALLENMTEQNQVTAKGKMHGNKLNLYEIVIGDKNYVLLYK
jgi:hypothetical protein